MDAAVLHQLERQKFHLLCDQVSKLDPDFDGPSLVPGGNASDASTDLLRTVNRELRDLIRTVGGAR